MIFRPSDKIQCAHWKSPTCGVGLAGVEAHQRSLHITGSDHLKSRGEWRIQDDPQGSDWQNQGRVTPYFSFQEQKIKIKLLL